MAKTTLEFSDAAADELARIAEASSTTKADVIRRALALYGYLVNELKPKPDGGKIELGIIENEKDIKKIVVVPGLTYPGEQESASGEG